MGNQTAEQNLTTWQPAHTLKHAGIPTEQAKMVTKDGFIHFQMTRIDRMNESSLVRQAQIDKKFDQLKVRVPTRFIVWAGAICSLMMLQIKVL